MLPATVDELLSRRIRPDGPGVAVLVLVNGKPMYAGSRGLANLAGAVPITGRTLFELASVSKQFTAMSMLILADRGRLDLEDEVRAYLPELPVLERGRPIRLIDLLWHTSGLPDYLHQFAGDYHSGLSRVRNHDLPRLLHGQPIVFPPGTRHEYSNSNYALLPLVVDRAAGESYPAFLRKHVFRPLGMNTALVPLESVEEISGRASGYDEVGGAYQLSECPNAIWGDGSVWASSEDMGQWAHGLSGNAGKLVRDDLWDLMFRKGRLDSGAEFNYGLGIRVQQFCGHPVYGHGGRWAGYCSYFGFYGGQLAVAVLGNNRSLDAEDLADAIARAYLEA
jgi:CubicO group peptidase (beta-lactamase class C family)